MYSKITQVEFFSARKIYLVLPLCLQFQGSFYAFFRFRQLVFQYGVTLSLTEFFEANEEKDRETD